MATVSPSRPLDDVLRARWADSPKHSASVYDDGRLVALYALEQALVGDYWVFPNIDDDVTVAPEWIEGLGATIRETGLAAFEAHVVPSVIQALKEYLPSAPEELRVHPRERDAASGPRGIGRSRPMTVLTHNLDTINCSHDGIHGPDSEPGAVQRCHEETVIIIRPEGSPEGEALASALHRLTEELLPAYEKRVVREAMRLAAEVGHYRRLSWSPTMTMADRSRGIRRA